MFLKKKMITTNKNVVKYDFYNENNILIMGIDKPEKIKDFLRNDYFDIKKDIIDTYEFECWLRTF